MLSLLFMYSGCLVVAGLDCLAGRPAPGGESLLMFVFTFSSGFGAFAMVVMLLQWERTPMMWLSTVVLTLPALISGFALRFFRRLSLQKL